MIGTTISHYKVLEKIGEGGMGVVYRATDTKLNRDVALKILPEQFASDSQRMGRFQREAEVLASLDHPNIGQIYGIEEAGQTKALVLQLIEGPTLAERIAQGPIPVEDALKIALQMAEGLEAAHEKGVIHRDLKPANIKITPEGQVKILDFGLAKALEAEVPDSSLSQSPTLTNAATQAGVILGTAAYMSPEQAKGKAVDKRADLWAFGCVLFEMLSGQTAFPGRDVTDILAAVLRAEPEWSGLPGRLHPRLREVLERCLAKDPGRRQRDAGDIRLDLEVALLEEANASPSETSFSRRIAGWIPWLLAGALGVTVLGLVLREATPSETVPGTRRFSLDLPWQNMPNWVDFRVRISPQGTHLAYPGSDENRTTITLRPFDSLEAVTLVSPSAGSGKLAFSPDGERLAFFIGRQLQTVSIHGGQPELLFDFSEERVYGNGLSWGSDRSILAAGSSGLWRVSTSSGEAQLVAAAEEPYRSPFSLGDGDHALVSIVRSPNSRIAIVDLTTGTVRELPFQGIEPIYSPTGHVLFRQGGELFAFRFDLDSLEAQGQAVAIASGVAYGPRLSDDGTLVYVAERAEGTAALVWVNRQGVAVPVPGERRDYTHIDLSPDGTSALLQVRREIYASDLNRGSNILVSGSSGFPLWHPDNERATFQGGGLFSRKADGIGQAQQLLPQLGTIPTSWSPDGENLAFFDRQSDVWILPSEGDPQPFLTGPANERSARFSPDGSALAYVSDESGEFQVYVTSFPEPGSRIAVSINGGLSPIWSSDGDELYFRQGGKVMAARVSVAPEIEASRPELLFDGPYTVDLSGHQRYDVAPDGRFLMVENSEDFRVVVVEGFFEELERLVPTDN